MEKAADLISQLLKKSFQETEKKYFFSKNDPLDLRIGDWAQSYDLSNIEHTFEKKNCCILGYPDDQGIQNNGGRPGAKEAPNGIRHLLYKLVLTERIKSKQLLDIGNFNFEKHLSLEKSHEIALEIIYKLNQKDQRIITFGGGHDYGFPDSCGFTKAQLEKGLRPVIINFDAHLDVRDDKKGINSGVPFFKLLTQFGSSIDFYEIGIQKHCNSEFHFNFVKQNHGHIITTDQLKNKKLNLTLSEIIQKHNQQPLLVSLDIDVINSSEAPGCSQSWPSGLNYQELEDGFNLLAQHPHWVQLGIYEVSPPLDVNMNIQRAAALLTYQFLNRE